jgi:hypothetical protein
VVVSPFVEIVAHGNAMRASLIVEKHFSFVPNDLADLKYLNYVFLDLKNASSFDDDFILFLDDVDEAFFVGESLILLVFDNNNPNSFTQFGTVISWELENVRRGGIRRLEAIERWASKLFDDYRKFRGISNVKSIRKLLKEKKT